MQSLYHTFRRKLVERADRAGHWCNARTVEAYRFRDPRVQRLARKLPQVAGSVIHVLKLLPRLDALRLEGRGWNVSYVGDLHMLDELEALLFPDGASRHPRPRIPAWGVRSFVRSEAGRADLVVCALPHVWPRAWRPAGPVAFTCPVFANALVDISRPVGELLRGASREPIRRQLKVASRAELSPRLTRERLDLEHFYWNMYRPHIQKRHGARALISSLEDQWTQWIVPGGCLLLLERQGRPLAGVLGRLIGSTYVGGEEGIAQTPEAEEHGYGLRATLKVAHMEHARAVGATSLLRGNSLARCADPVMASKLQFGPRVVPSERCQYPEWTFVAERLDGALRDHLNSQGLITFVGSRPCVVSIGPPTTQSRHMAKKIGSLLVVEPGQPGRVEGA